MTTLYLDRRDLTIELAPQRLRIRHPQDGIRDVPLALIERVIVTAKVVLDSSVLTALAARGIAMVMLNPRSTERAAFVTGPPHNDAMLRLAQCRAVDDPVWCAGWARHIVRGKIGAQRVLLDQGLEKRPDQRHSLSQSIERLDRALAQCGLVDDIASLRGVEGAAAAAYFGAYATLVPSGLLFTGRNRRPPRDPVNALLSLGYTLLHFDAVRALYAAGLDPFLGFYHGLTFGRESLASDLIEPIRPLVDRLVWRLLAEKQLRADHFRMEGGACMLGKAGRMQFYAAYEEAAGNLRRKLRVASRSLVRVLRNRSPPDA